MRGVIYDLWRSAAAFGGPTGTRASLPLAGGKSGVPSCTSDKNAGKTGVVTPHYYSLDCIPAPDGQFKIIDVHGGVGGGLTMLATAYAGKAAARDRLGPYLQALGEVAGGRTILFI